MKRSRDEAKQAASDRQHRFGAWQEAKLRLRVALLGPGSRMSLIGRLALLAILLAAVFIAARAGSKSDESIEGNKRLQAVVDERVNTRIAQQCASYGADISSYEADQTLFEGLLRSPRRPNDSEFRRRLEAASQAKQRARDQKVLLRTQLKCPPYPPAPLVQPVPTP
jgi:hypothetical protein